MSKYIMLLYIAACTPYAGSFDGSVPDGLSGSSLSQVNRRVVEHVAQEDNLMGKDEKMIRVLVKDHEGCDRYVYTDLNDA